MALLDRTLPPPPLPVPSTGKDDTLARIQRIWQQNLPVLHSRLDQLAAAASAAHAQTLSDTDRDEAISIAHKLAGSLGMFGFPEGTVLAHRLESALTAPALNPDTLTQLTDQLRAALRPSA